MVAIFMFSNQTADISSKTSGCVIEKIASVLIADYSNMTTQNKQSIISNMQNIVRKTAHFAIYFMLGLFTFSAMLTYTMRNRRRVLTAAAICLTYAASDEFHQMFLPGRGPQILDVCLDFCGSILGISIVFLISYLIIKRTCKTKAGTN